MEDKIEIMSINVRGLGQEVKRRKLFTWLHKQRMSIILLQETHSIAEVEKEWKTEWGGEIIYSHGARNARGTAILIKSDLKNVEIHEVKRDQNGRCALVDLNIGKMRLTIGNIYGPNVDDDGFYKEALDLIDSLPNDNRILGGDFNLVLNLGKDKMGGVNRTLKKSRQLVLNWMEHTNMVDIWRLQHQDRRQYTYHTEYPGKISSRLDFFLTSGGIAPLVHRSSITHGYLTDHESIRIVLQIKVEPRGPGLWKLNTSLLKDKSYIDKIKETISETVVINSTADAQLLWETIKLQCRGASIQYSSRKKKSTKNLIRILEKKIEELETKQLDEPNEQNAEHLRKLKQDLDTEIQKISNGIFIRSNVRWHEEGERPTRYFYDLEKRNFNKKTIKKRKTEIGGVITGKNEILGEMENFYSTLYKTKRDVGVILNEDNFFQNEAPKLSEEEKQLTDNLITEEELLSALKHTKNNKSPGSDGFPAEFYKVFWLDIKKYLVDSVNYAYNVGSLSIIQKQGVISLLPKAGRDPMWLKNWRPITLLNQDYKLISKVLAFRLKGVLPKIINPDQTGFVKDRYIGENITRIFNIMDYADEEELEAVIMSVDYEKAFDCLEWDFLEKALEYFNFGNGFKKWIRTLYNNITSCVVNNGWTTASFNPSRGVRQGCPISPYLFIICAEIFAIEIRANENIKGIKMGEDVHKIIQFADDTALILKFEEGTLRHTYAILTEFSYISGLRINLEKTIIMRIGNIKHSLEIILPEQNVQWTNESIKLLGVVIPNDRSRLTDLNYVPKLEKIKNCIKVWKQRKLTFYGKVQLIKSQLVSQIIYLMSVMVGPTLEYIKELEAILFKFLWNDKTERIKRRTLYLPLLEGGISMPHLPSFNYALKLAWIRRLLEHGNEGLWKKMVWNQLPIQDMYIWNCNLNSADAHLLTEFIPYKFWKEVIMAWSLYNFQEPKNENEIREQNLWFNSFIKVENKPIFYKQWYTKGIRTIEDLLTENGSFLTFHQFVNKYNVNSNFLKYYGILSAIPAQWKNNLLQVNREDIHIITKNNLDRLLTFRKVCKESYSTFLENIFQNIEPTRAISKWENVLQLPEGSVEISLVFNNIYNSTRSRKLQACQFQVLHRSLVTNVDLLKWNLKDSENCTFCNNCPETLQHLFLECTTSSFLWQKIKLWLSRNTGIAMNIRNEDIIFGFTDEHFLLYDLVFTVAKQYIYNSRCLEKQPSFIGFLNVLRNVKETEFHSAELYGKVNQYESKWTPLLRAFDTL